MPTTVPSSRLEDEGETNFEDNVAEEEDAAPGAFEGASADEDDR